MPSSIFNLTKDGVLNWVAQAGRTMALRAQNFSVFSQKQIAAAKQADVELKSIRKVYREIRDTDNLESVLGEMIDALKAGAPAMREHWKLLEMAAKGEFNETHYWVINQHGFIKTIYEINDL